jgi:hypothetical protein
MIVIAPAHARATRVLECAASPQGAAALLTTPAANPVSPTADNADNEDNADNADNADDADDFKRVDPRPSRFF